MTLKDQNWTPDGFVACGFHSNDRAVILGTIERLTEPDKRRTKRGFDLDALAKQQLYHPPPFIR